MIRIDSSEVQDLANMLQRTIPVAPAEARIVVRASAERIKAGMRERASGLAHAPALPNAVTYDTTAGATSAEAEIGPDKARRQGALGNLINYGSVNNGPHPFVEPAADDEQPKFEKAMEDVALKALEGL